MQNGERFARIESQEKLCPDLIADWDLYQISDTNLYGPKLKSTVQWIPHPDGYWILRNSEGVTCLQVDNSDKEVMEELGFKPIGDIADIYDITLEDLQYLLRMLAETGMLEGTQPPKPPQNKFNIQQLLSFQIPLLNPDAWLTKHAGKLRWIWTWQFAFFLCVLISASLAIWLALADEVSASNQQVWATGEITTLLTFVLLIMIVVGLHELGHAFTLKHYGGVVPEMGLLFLCLIPGCYTDTTEQYSLVRRKQRVFVVAAGVLVQVAIWAFSVWVWVLSKPNSGWHLASYLLMVATLVTVVFNLNPLNKFDGYYLLVALTGINNLRSRSFQFYDRLLRREQIWEEPSDCWTLAA
ncbi:MAG: M50 family metallopeptidase [Microcoleus sp. PH2017_15_JOR_U_A]|uniref:M50 family metallopeptidase n=1 Tax=unclassified Microcoleus TaxID=2642155 RepID=UPI001D899B0E|nr:MULTISPECIES: M50 family metallopeptidase [unclassified Microcoleus]MCC3476361.1 M50 family metallopeptidase [Microcoleus sp. PH2017_13_LAR_U_A]MCC3488796.1 M50 family metallopeptidase [Microcoleus sp. PH2017_14_LAR_D_A]MCC3501136.1 M50 family metallopeptidase [Microcoleus sp. PH2017_15_JOR_U_A]MCC3601474.1 M50 family metallopeptidase [Microcoleus sp. PH2017_26_ELK_O_A]MCC3626657.1 M50 family metallopeptidase [Microcoleus sp. PH2017_36_ELK_O_B]